MIAAERVPQGILRPLLETGGHSCQLKHPLPAVHGFGIGRYLKNFFIGVAAANVQPCSESRMVFDPSQSPGFRECCLKCDFSLFNRSPRKLDDFRVSRSGKKLDDERRKKLRNILLRGNQETSNLCWLEDDNRQFFHLGRIYGQRTASNPSSFLCEANQDPA